MDLDVAGLEVLKVGVRDMKVAHKVAHQATPPRTGGSWRRGWGGSKGPSRALDFTKPASAVRARLALTLGFAHDPVLLSRAFHSLLSVRVRGTHHGAHEAGGGATAILHHKGRENAINV
jgi:hypothetical protein